LVKTETLNSSSSSNPNDSSSNPNDSSSNISVTKITTTTIPVGKTKQK
jgi:hypothetical protein